MAFSEIALIISAAALFGIVATWLKQPAILGYIIAGFVLALIGHMNPHSIEMMDSLGSLGVALLLFLVGLEMNFDKIRHLGWHIAAIGIFQSTVSIGAGFLLMKLLGFGFVPAIYLALAFSFSSTIVVIKFLSEKKDLDSLYGRIVVGLMLLEDLIAILMLIFLKGISGGGNIGVDFGITLIKGIILVAATLLISRVMPRIISFVGQKGESIFLFSLAWGIGIAALVASEKIGLGIEAGGFLAGLAFAKSAEHFEISGKIKWLRDFFIVIFFVLLGSTMVIGADFGSILVPAIIASLFVLIVNPIITIIGMKILGYSGKTAFLAGITTAQISEFSLVIAARGGEMGHLTNSEITLVTLVGIITIVGSSSLISNSDFIYKSVSKVFKSLKSAAKSGVESTPKKSDNKNHVVVIGAHRLGKGILKSLISLKEPFVVVDFDPQTTKNLEDKGITVIHGDGGDRDVQEAAGFREARLIISTAPSLEDNMLVLEGARYAGKAKVVLTADSEWEGAELYKAGADYVIMPHFLGGEHLGEIMSRTTWAKDLRVMREKDIVELDRQIVSPS